MIYCPRLRLGTIYIMCPRTNNPLYCTVDWGIKPHYRLIFLFVKGKKRKIKIYGSIKSKAYFFVYFLL